MNHHAEIKMNVDQFLEWCSTQSEGHFELIDGEVVPMSPERSVHNLTKYYVVRALADAIKDAKIDCTAYTDGMGVRIDDDNLIEPDASVQIGKPMDRDVQTLTAPVIVVEVLSPSSAKNDASAKLVAYLSVKSIVHYLIVDADREIVVHHRRITSDECETRIVSHGSISLSPPGIEVPIQAFFGKY
jgi:Uma2 family endonuclease